MVNEHKCTQNIKKKTLGFSWIIVVTRNTETFSLSFINYSSNIRFNIFTKYY